MLADFIKEGLVVLDETLETARGALVSANNVNDTIQFWDWQESRSTYFHESLFDCLCKQYALTHVTIISLHLHKL